MSTVLDSPTTITTIKPQRYRSSSSATWRSAGVIVTSDIPAPPPAPLRAEASVEPAAVEAEETSRDTWLYAFMNYAAGTIWGAASARADLTAREELIASAERALESIEAEHGSATSEARMTFKLLLLLLVAPGGPTPQPNVGEDGDIEVRWLVGGDLISAMIYEDGAYRLCGVAREGRVLFTKRAAKGDLPDLQAFRAASAQLAAMGKRVRFPALPRG